MAPPTAPPRARAGSPLTGFIDQNNDVTNICEGTNKIERACSTTYERKRRTGDFHGQEPVLWAASALLR